MRGFFSLTKGIGKLNLTRALGDFDLKKNPSLSPEKQIITADPDVMVYDIAEEEEFLVLACDGTLLSIVS
jgi:protein phosphatase 2C family protein 2/3